MGIVGGIITGTIFASTLVTAGRQMDAIGDQLELAALLTFFVRPIILFKATFDNDHGAFGEKLPGDFPLTAPRLTVNEDDLLALFAFCRFVARIVSDGEIGDGTIGADRAHFWVARQITGHDRVIDIHEGGPEWVHKNYTSYKPIRQ